MGSRVLVVNDFPPVDAGTLDAHVPCLRGCRPRIRECIANCNDATDEQGILVGQKIEFSNFISCVPGTHPETPPFSPP